MSAAKPSATIRYSALRLLIFVACFFVSGVAVHFGVIPSGVGGSNVVWVVLLGLVLSAPSATSCCASSATRCPPRSSTR